MFSSSPRLPSAVLASIPTPRTCLLLTEFTFSPYLFLHLLLRVQHDHAADAHARPCISKSAEGLMRLSVLKRAETK
jgi:hypothetical protein